MHFPVLRLGLHISLLAVLAHSASVPHARQVSTKVVLTNDDGWAVANVRALFQVLFNSGFNVLMSAPADNRSGTGSSDTPAAPLGPAGCEFSSCPANAPAEGSDPNNPRFNYVNSFPVTAVRFGIQNLSSIIFESPPDIVLSGPNVGTNLGSGSNGPDGSGTVGAACEAAKEGVPSVAFSGRSGSQVSFTTLSDTTAGSTIAAENYAALSVEFTNALLASSARPILPPNVTLNVNLPATSATQCPSPEDFTFVLTRVTTAVNGTPRDVSRCGTTRLPTEASVLGLSNACFISVSVMDATTKVDVPAATQAVVLERLESFLGCLPTN